MQRQQRAARQRHVAQRDGDLAHDTRIRRLEQEESRLRLRDPGLRLQRVDLGLGRLPLGLAALERGLADVLLLVQLPLPRQLAGGHLELGLRRLDLGRAGRHALLGRAGVNAQQLLAGLDPVAGLDLQRDDGAGDLGREPGLAHRLDHAVQAGLVRLARRAAQLHRGQRPTLGDRLGGRRRADDGQGRQRHQAHPM